MKISTLIVSLCLFAGACKDSKPESAAPSAAAPAPVAAAQPVAATAGDPPLIAVGTKMKCAVSGEEFTVKPTTTQIVYAGKRYAFCCSDCKPDFEKNPAKFAAK